MRRGKFGWGTLSAMLLAAAIGTVSSAAQAACRQALALGLDVSGSVDAQEYRLQMQGVAGALQHPDVIAALLGQPGGHVEVMVFEWSGPRDQHVVLNWRALRTEADIAAAAEVLRNAARVGGDPSTALGAAALMGAGALQQRDCTRRVLDLSGDGVANTGPLPQSVRRNPLLQGITVNALVIPDPNAQPSTKSASRHPTDPEGLVSYFQANVLHGPDAFAEMALGFENYEAAMTRKLIRELYGMGLVIGPKASLHIAGQ